MTPPDEKLEMFQRQSSNLWALHGAYISSVHIKVTNERQGLSLRNKFARAQIVDRA